MEERLKNYTYVSSLGQHMTDFICLKRSLGYKYNDEAYFLSQFDRYWADADGGSVFITYENVSGYLEQRQGETRRSHSHRIAVYWLKGKVARNGQWPLTVKLLHC